MCDLTSERFPALGVGCRFVLRALIGSRRYFRLLSLARCDDLRFWFYSPLETVFCHADVKFVHLLTLLGRDIFRLDFFHTWGVFK